MYAAAETTRRSWAVERIARRECSACTAVWCGESSRLISSDTLFLASFQEVHGAFRINLSPPRSSRVGTWGHFTY